MTNFRTNKQATKGMLSKQTYLAPELAFQCREQRRVVASVQHLQNHVDNYGRLKYRICWLDLPVVCKKAAKVLVIVREHPVLGNYILFKVWHEAQDQMTGAAA